MLQKRNLQSKAISGELLHKKNDFLHLREGTILPLHKTDKFAHKNEKRLTHA